MKKILFILITFVLIYIIYNCFSIKRINYVSITDNVLNGYNEYLLKDKFSNFNSYFTSSSVSNFYKDVISNKTIKVNDEIYYLKKVLRESDILVISIGMEELTKVFNKYDLSSNNNYFLKMFERIKLLIKEIKRYAYGKIIFLGYYNPTYYYDSSIDQFFYDINIKLERLMIDNDITYLDLYEIVKKNKLEDNIDKIIANIIKYYLS